MTCQPAVWIKYDILRLLTFNYLSLKIMSGVGIFDSAGLQILIWSLKNKKEEEPIYAATRRRHSKRIIVKPFKALGIPASL